MDIMVCYQELLSLINSSGISFKCKDVLNKVYSNKKLISMIKEYNDSYNDNLRNEIYDNCDFMTFKKLENEVNMLIFEINSIFKELENEDN